MKDEKNIADFIEKILRSNDYKVVTASTGDEGLSLIKSRCPDIILLDLGLPDMDGLDVISSVRSWSLCPIIVLSARTTDNDKVSSLDLGADDYITKPFSTNELLARIRTSLRHSNRVVTNDSVSEKPYAALGLKIDFMKRIITRDGEPIHLTPVEYKIVAYIDQKLRQGNYILLYYLKTFGDQIWTKMIIRFCELTWLTFEERLSQILRNLLIFLLNWVWDTECWKILHYKKNGYVLRKSERNHFSYSTV